MAVTTDKSTKTHFLAHLPRRREKPTAVGPCRNVSMRNKRLPCRRLRYTGNEERSLHANFNSSPLLLHSGDLATSCVLPFPGTSLFLQGRHFRGDDTKLVTGVKIHGSTFSVILSLLSHLQAARNLTKDRHKSFLNTVATCPAPYRHGAGYTRVPAVAGDRSILGGRGARGGNKENEINVLA